MRALAPLGCGGGAYSIAIYAPVRTGVVAADIPAFRAEAAGTISLRPRSDGVAGHIRQTLHINASCRPQPRAEKIGLTAEAGPDPPITKDRRKFRQKNALFFFCRIPPGEAVSLGRQVALAPRFGIDLREGQNGLVNQISQQVGKTRHLLTMKCRRRQIAQKNRIIAPDKTAPAEMSGQRA